MTESDDKSISTEQSPGQPLQPILLIPEEYLEDTRKRSSVVIKQIEELIKTKGVIHPFIGLPDVHAGVNYPVGVCCTLDPDNPNCEIPIEAIGGDINCGVRIWRTNIQLEEFIRNRQRISADVKRSVPTNKKEVPSGLSINRILEEGMDYLVEIGVVRKEDRKCIEKDGRYAVETHKCISQKAKARGLSHLGTLGSGNHYLEFHYVSEIYNAEDADRLNLRKDTVCVSVHTGSRGLGSRALFEYAKKNKLVSNNGSSTPLCVRLHSKEGAEYMNIINAASNYALCNRTVIGAAIGKALQKTAPGYEMYLISDAAHNIIEKDLYKEKNVISLRKGSTKVYPPGHASGNRMYKEIGTPVYVGGSMTTGGYLIKAGTESCKTNYTTCHGSGRIIRRKNASREIDKNIFNMQLERSNVLICADSSENLIEESESAYKDIEKVVEFCEKQKISERICRLLPLAVIKG